MTNYYEYIPFKKIITALTVFPLHAFFFSFFQTNVIVNWESDRISPKHVIFNMNVTKERE